MQTLTHPLDATAPWIGAFKLRRSSSLPTRQHHSLWFNRLGSQASKLMTARLTPRAVGTVQRFAVDFEADNVAVAPATLKAQGFRQSPHQLASVFLEVLVTVRFLVKSSSQSTHVEQQNHCTGPDSALKQVGWDCVQTKTQRSTLCYLDMSSTPRQFSQKVSQGAWAAALQRPRAIQRPQLAIPQSM